jgi:membrane-associated phospholipid phosphatase
VNLSVTSPVRREVLPLDARRWEQWRWRIVIALAVIYVLMAWGVLVRSPLISLDQWAFNYAASLRASHPNWYSYLNTYVMFGQRWPGMMTAIPFVVWVAYRARSFRPILTMGIALVALNLSVGAVKLGIGRLGPTQTHDVYTRFAGGDIFPSGHVSNAVVLFGVLTMMSTRFKKQMVWITVFLSVTVGLTTVYLATHWLSDVIAGWIAGALVLLILPTVVPWVEAVLAQAGRPVRWALHLPKAKPELPNSPADDAGELLGAYPESSSDDLVAGGTGGRDPLRVPAQFTQPVRTVVGAPDSFRGRRREEGRERTPVGALRHDAVADRHDKILE